MIFTDSSRAVCLAIAATAVSAADHPGLTIYKEHCGRCHGDSGVGTRDLPDPLVGDLSVNQLAACVDETMPEDDPTRVTGEAARQVAEYIHGAFSSPVARDRNRTADWAWAPPCCRFSATCRVWPPRRLRRPRSD